MNVTEAFCQVLSTLSASYEVPDILLPSSDLIFILESPHVQELKFGAPVSGPSGATMTKHLFGERYARFPLGRLVKKNADEAKNRPRLNRIGLMNVCNIPMQASAYPDPVVRREYREWLNALMYIRSNNQRDTYADPLYNEVQAVLVGGLRRKLERLQERPLTLVPCGRFAQKFLRLAAVESPHWQVIDGVPHPSYNSWDRPQYREVVARVRQVLGDPPEEAIFNGSGIHASGSGHPGSGVG
ncbi:MAG: hypothetical protein K6T81_02095 [Alicyclobacillus macrosporangiidus]|uniref:hypothetical protein n=1 Tax=Alicyclobacillus macrosporangiidus TaxID=392015 RepID=UPI0026E91FA6|nr:hypothetical protein [Alicyclobacillus macrosporangiidus]MCL6597514.1 hypothetical protein [Alicyclobacillus macrosporangiidus]